MYFYLSVFSHPVKIDTTRMINTSITPDIHTGESTQNQDHSIILVSFRTIKVIVNRPTKPTLEELLDDFIMILIV